MQFPTQFLCAGSLLMMLAVAGCGGGQPTGEVVPVVKAAGKVTWKGQPLEYHQVILFPAGDGRPAAGVSDAEGAFVLGTNAPNDGAVKGTHRVAVTYVGPPNTNPEAGMTDFTPPPPPKVKIDKKYANVETSGITVEIPSSGKTDILIELQ